MRCSFLLFSLLASLSLQAAEWRMQPESRFGFEATFEGSAAPGRFEKFDLELDFDPARPTIGQLTVTVDLAAADMGDPDMNAVIADPAWFDPGSFPVATFSSRSIEQTAPNKFLVTGVLDLKGVRKTVAVPFAWSEWGDHAEMRGDFVLQRIDFNIGSGEWATGDAIGIDVRLQFSILLTR